MADENVYLYYHGKGLIFVNRPEEFDGLHGSMIVGKRTWLSGLLKCGSCRYSVKVNWDRDKHYLVCSGRSNLGLCTASIQIDIRALEASVEVDLERLLAECPDVKEPTATLEEINRKIDRLISALTESSGLTMPYNRTLKTLCPLRLSGLK